MPCPQPPPYVKKTVCCLCTCIAAVHRVQRFTVTTYALCTTKAIAAFRPLAVGGPTGQHMQRCVPANPRGASTPCLSQLRPFEGAAPQASTCTAVPRQIVGFITPPHALTHLQRGPASEHGLITFQPTGTDSQQPSRAPAFPANRSAAGPRSEAALTTSLQASHSHPQLQLQLQGPQSQSHQHTVAEVAPRSQSHSTEAGGDNNPLVSRR